MSKLKDKIDNLNDLELISSNNENAVYRIAIPKKDFTLKEKQKILKNAHTATIHYFNLEDFQRLKAIEAEIIQKLDVQSTKKSFSDYFYKFLEI
jgi:hypothetical protein